MSSSPPRSHRTAMAHEACNRGIRKWSLAPTPVILDCLRHHLAFESPSLEHMPQWNQWCHSRKSATPLSWTGTLKGHRAGSAARTVLRHHLAASTAFTGGLSFLRQTEGGGQDAVSVLWESTDGRQVGKVVEDWWKWRGLCLGRLDDVKGPGQ